jgi:hypothetical protein
MGWSKIQKSNNKLGFAPIVVAASCGRRIYGFVTAECDGSSWFTFAARV